MFLGTCSGCGCKIYSDWIEEFEGHYCNHEIQTTLDEKEILINEDSNQEGPHTSR
jgi:hypothetical protein